ncbi:MAG: L-histidine N(alpha)-methyltransferase, partial [Pseudomonadota bacterium]
TIIEPGSGEAIKVRPLIEALGARADAYVPIDIASDQLDAVAKELSALYPDLTVRGIATDFFSPFKIDQPDNAVIFFPGSTVGNMTESAAVGFLRNLRRATGAKRFLIGFDLVKDRHVLEEAYDDPAGVTAAFTKNVLQRINRELGGTFDLDLFEFRADYEDEKSAVVMQLVAQEAHSVSVAGTTISFEAGETIHTEDSRKYTVDRFASFAKKAELVPLKTWTDKDRYFAVMLLDTIDA